MSRAGTIVLSGIAAAAMMIVAAPAGAAAPTPGGRDLPAPLPPGFAEPSLLQAIGQVTQVGSTNWSGYAQSVSTSTFHGVSDTWTVPTVNTSLPGNQFSSDWVGIGGVTDGTLVQAGTEADNFGGTAVYGAWTEILPAAEDPLSLAIHPGDTITTSVIEIQANMWQMTVEDLTTHQSQGRTVEYSGSSHASVEAIHERPCIADGCSSVEDLANLTDTSNVTFDPGKYSTKAKKKPKKGLLKPARGATLYQLFMLNNSGTAVIAAPSSPDSDLDGFTVAFGSTSPAPPPS
jgi:Peptidase A4 family